MYAEASAPPLWICCIRSSQVEADVISPLWVAMVRRPGVDRPRAHDGRSYHSRARRDRLALAPTLPAADLARKARESILSAYECSVPTWIALIDGLLTYTSVAPFDPIHEKLSVVLAVVVYPTCAVFIASPSPYEPTL
jgi:hypothetical protein